MTRPKKETKPRSGIDYVRYDGVRHQLEIGMFEQKFVYMGVPESVHARLILAEIPDQVFMQEVFNRYPVCITPEPQLKPIKRRKK